MASPTSILDMVKVMCIAIQEGKIAVHCHAGLGRTGTVLFYVLKYIYNLINIPGPVFTNNHSAKSCS